MTTLILTLGFITYCIYAWIGYDISMRNSSYFYVSGMALALLANVFWLILVRISESQEKIAYYGTLWEVVVIVSSIIPIFIFKIKTDAGFWIGLSLVLIGVMVMRIFSVVGK